MNEKEGTYEYLRSALLDKIILAKSRIGKLGTEELKLLRNKLEKLEYSDLELLNELQLSTEKLVHFWTGSEHNYTMNRDIERMFG